MKREKTLLIVAGEPSGDLHGARLMRSLREQSAESLRFVGIGGKAMEAEGLVSLVPLERMSVVGFWEVAKRYGFFRDVLRRCIGLLESECVAGFIAIDYPGFNERLARAAKSRGIRVMWYIAPQLWAWGKHRAKSLAKCIDRLLVVFPFERDFFEGFGIATEFVGHPLLDDAAFSGLRGGGGDVPMVALLPGSRYQELQRNLPVMLEAALLVRRELGICVAIAQSPSLPASAYRKMLSDYGFEDYELWTNSRQLMLNADVGMVKTGTSTLEACLCGMPFLMMYRTSTLSYWIGRFLVRLPFISLPNIVLGRECVREFVQSAATAEQLACELLLLLRDGAVRERQRADFNAVRGILGSSGASAKAAKVILEHV
ncbi:MAG TPA: lipid-A-disaccharide synthase [Candidatus Kapabacteria bacterium]|jgi:lipid-A-disaccharide synthase|nr:lipid-A-disaccharide synthase [Candidatus Kapabacteria bacterium]HRK60315.1 lipid-A-disaccharide synthase [Candidatus Kapabacteria bacterium]